MLHHLLFDMLTQGILLLIKCTQQRGKYHREEAAQHADTWIRNKVSRHVSSDLAIDLHLAHFLQRNGSDIIGRTLDSETGQQFSIFFERQKFKVITRMLGNTLNAKFEAGGMAFNRISTYLTQLCLDPFDNLFISNGHLERFTFDVHHPFREEQVRPDAIASIGEEMDQAIIDHVSKQPAHLTQLMVGKDQLVVAQFRENSGERPALSTRQDSRRRGYKVSD